MRKGLHVYACLEQTLRSTAGLRSGILLRTACPKPILVLNSRKCCPKCRRENQQNRYKAPRNSDNQREVVNPKEEDW